MTLMTDATMEDEARVPMSLSAARAAKHGDARLWSVGDCLSEALKDSSDGRWTKCHLVFYRPDGKGGFLIDIRTAGCTTLEARGLMFCAIRDEMIDA